MAIKRNCWEIKKCGYGPNGDKAYQVGMCTAAMLKGLHGTHGGINGGRACWVVKDTYCKTKKHNNFAQEYLFCMGCDFYLKVKREEKDNFIESFNLIKKLR